MNVGVSHIIQTVKNWSMREAGSDDVFKNGQTLFGDNQEMHKIRVRPRWKDLGDNSGLGSLGAFSVLPKPHLAAIERGFHWLEFQVGWLEQI